MEHLKSLREYIERLSALGEIQPIDVEVDCHLELGAIIRRSYDLRAPAPLFRRLRGIEPGFRVLGAPAAASRTPGRMLCRVAVSLGLPPDASARAIVDALARARERAPVPPVRVAHGPCKENILRGAEVDLERLPAPLIHEGDGGRYLNTWGTLIAKTPDGAWTNWCITRVMLHGRDTLVGMVSPLQHIGRVHAAWRAIGRPMPFALALGTEPAMPFVSGMPLPKGYSEADFLGAYFGAPVELVAAETVPLEVPATAEIVIEGHISIDETALEGPMGEYAGYQNRGKSSPQPLFRVSAMTHRDDPILPVVAAGAPIEEDHTCWGLAIAATVLADLRRHEFPVGTVFSPLESAVHWLVITVTPEGRKRHTRAELLERVRDLVLKSRPGGVISRFILVDDDIDPGRIEDVVWALATRCHPERGQKLFTGLPVPPLQVYLDAEERRTNISSKVVFDCLWPDEMKPEARPVPMTFREGWPADIQERVVRDWTRYGYADR